MLLQLCSFCHSDKQLIEFLKCGEFLLTMLAGKNNDNIIEKVEHLFWYPSQANLINVNSVYHS